MKNKLYLEDSQNNAKNLNLSLGRDKIESKIIINEKDKKNKKENKKLSTN